MSTISIDNKKDNSNLEASSKSTETIKNENEKKSFFKKFFFSDFN